MFSLPEHLAHELGVQLTQVEAAIALLDGGATVPFIARYRKEVTGGLSDEHLRNLEDRLHYLRELEERRQAILSRLQEQGKLSDVLKQAITAADSKTRLEDLYKPYAEKRHTKAQKAKAAGLEPLSLALLANPALAPLLEAEKFLNAELGFATAEDVLEGARYILMDHFSEDADLIGRLREYAWNKGLVESNLVNDKQADPQAATYTDYFSYQEKPATIPSHRALALFRGSKEGFLKVQFNFIEPEYGEQAIRAHFKLAHQGRPADAWLLETAKFAWKVRIYPHLDTEIKRQLKERAEEEAIKVFARNLKHLLLAAPAGPRPTLGLDPGLRTGVKVAVLDATGKLLTTGVIYPHEPRKEWQQSLATLAQLVEKFKIELIAIGNGTASRETEKLASELIQQQPQLKITKVVVSEAGASVYSASALASKEFPDIDVTLRGAVSIARRLQDPLAELVKIDPKAIGVGQYQHDVNQSRLAKTLDTVVEDCVNTVGVDVNTASVPLLARVAGLNATLAQNIVRFRDEHGGFRSRQQLTEVSRLGDKVFQQAAGFLRIAQGDNPLDASAVHPEAYPVVERILQQVQEPISAIIGNITLLQKLDAKNFTDAQFGLPTVKDILQELEKPGRDPRPEFKTATFKEDIHRLEDLSPGLMLEGVVTNVTNFGAFVDIGVHQDGLVHISELADKFVQDSHTVVKPGDIVKVRVMEVDVVRKRIALSMRKQSGTSGFQEKPSTNTAKKPVKNPQKEDSSIRNNSLSNALAQLKRKD